MERAVALFKRASELQFQEKKPEAAFILCRHILKHYPDFQHKTIIYQMLDKMGEEELDFSKIVIEDFPEEERSLFAEILEQLGLKIDSNPAAASDNISAAGEPAADANVPAADDPQAEAGAPLVQFSDGGQCEEIRFITLEHVDRYAEIYAKAFTCEPWNDPWKPEDALIHIRELMEIKQSFGLEYLVDGEVAGFILGTSMLFHYGRTFEINDLAVDPVYQRRGIARKLMNTCLSELKKQGIVAVHLITAGESILPAFYESFGFSKENEVILMGAEI